MTDSEAFEAWHDDKNMPYPNGHECPHRYWEWQAWQAALAAERAKQAEPVPFNAPGKAHVEAMLGSAAPPAVQAEPVALHIDDAECVMYAALRAAHERGPVSDDKVLLDELAKRGVYLCRAAPPADDEAVRLRAVLRNVIRDAGKTQQELREHAWKIIRERWEVLNPNGGQPWGYAELQEDSIADAAIDAYLAKVGK